jgi:nicotinamidase/pyrazinamidase
VVATQDWHPADHGSFAINNPGTTPYQLGELAGLPQVMWPAHCVQGTRGAELCIETRGVTIFRKGTHRDIDSYSGLHDNGHRAATGLGDWLRAHAIDELVVLGLATDYCVKFTVLDARAEGFAVTVVEDGCRAVELAPGDGARAFAAMRAAGARVVTSAEI